MDRKTANIIIRVFVALWILLSAVILCMLLCADNAWQEYREFIIQLAVSLLCSICLGIYIVISLKIRQQKEKMSRTK